MNLDQWLDRIGNLHPVKWDLGLERVTRVAEHLDIRKPAPLVFLVAGTNGKGSTCQYLEQSCLALGMSTGKTTSPHLQRFNERIQVNGRPVSDAKICRAFETIEAARAGISLTYFEFAALAAMLIFRQEAVQVAILEVGLGGRLDAMNLADPDVCIITRIALDHMNWLGETREQIAVEKAGILRPGVPCVIADPEPPASLADCIRQTGAPAWKLGTEFGVDRDVLWFTSATVTGDRTRRTFSVGRARLPVYCAAAALQALACAGLSSPGPSSPGRSSPGPSSPGPSSPGPFLSEGEIRRVIDGTELPGRMQLVPGSPALLLDVAHNPDAADYLRRHLEKEHSGRRIHAVVGMYRDKDCRGVLGRLEGLVDRWYLSDMMEDRAASATELAACLSADAGCRVSTYAKVSLACQGALETAGKDDLVVVFGSFPAVASAMDVIGIDLVRPDPEQSRK